MPQRISIPTPFGVEGLERVGAENSGFLLVHVVREEAPGIVAERPMVVCVRSLVPKEKNSANLSDLPGQQRCARELDHGPDDVVESDAGFLDQFIGDTPGGLFENPELLPIQNERMHDLR